LLTDKLVKGFSIFSVKLSQLQFHIHWEVDLLHKIMSHIKHFYWWIQRLKIKLLLCRASGNSVWNADFTCVHFPFQFLSGHNMIFIKRNIFTYSSNFWFSFSFKFMLTEEKSTIRNFFHKRTNRKLWIKGKWNRTISDSWCFPANLHWFLCPHTSLGWLTARNLHHWQFHMNLFVYDCAFNCI
jgi:hypothetical protein